MCLSTLVSETNVVDISIEKFGKSRLQDPIFLQPYEKPF